MLCSFKTLNPSKLPREIVKISKKIFSSYTHLVSNYFISKGFLSIVSTIISREIKILLNILSRELSEQHVFLRSKLRQNSVREFSPTLKLLPSNIRITVIEFVPRVSKKSFFLWKAENYDDARLLM